MSFLRRFSNSATGILAGVHCNLSTFRVDGWDFVAHTYSVLYTLYTVFTNRSIEFIYECLDRGLYTFKQIFHINIHAVADCKCCKLPGVMHVPVGSKDSVTRFSTFPPFLWTENIFKLIFCLIICGSVERVINEKKQWSKIFWHGAIKQENC